MVITKEMKAYLLTVFSFKVKVRDGAKKCRKAD